MQNLVCFPNVLVITVNELPSIMIWDTFNMLDTMEITGGLLICVFFLGI